MAAKKINLEQMKQTDAGHPLLQNLVDSICVIDGVICWNHCTMYDIRDKLQQLESLPPPNNERCKASGGGSKCVSWCGDKICLK